LLDTHPMIHGVGVQASIGWVSRRQSVHASAGRATARRNPPEGFRAEVAFEPPDGAPLAVARGEDHPLDSEARR
jgi:hypothetical protein